MPRRADAITNGIGTGPSWYDAWEMHRAMEKSIGKRIEIRMTSSRGANGQFGWRVTALLEDEPKLFGWGCYGPAFPGNGQKSFAASVYRALLALDEEVSKAWLEAGEATQSPLIT